MWHDIALPALCKLCIREPEPRYAPLRDALESFIYLRQLSGHIVAVEYERLWTNELLGTGTVFVRCTFLSRTNVLEAGSLSQQVIIEMLSDDVLLNIFHHFLHASPQFWHTLTHVCQKWRQIIFESPGSTTSTSLYIWNACLEDSRILAALSSHRQLRRNSPSPYSRG